MLFLLGAGIGAGAYRTIVTSSGRGAGARAPDRDATVTASPFFREGDKIVVPDGSLLRSRIATASVEVTERPRRLLLPATVEADPARTVKVLPPIAGRIIDLKVQLRDRVTRGQPLAVMDAPDLGQAYADDDKARSMVTLTRHVLDRQRGLVEARAGATKDLEQAESDYRQAQAEFQRTEARLKAIGASAELAGNSRLLTLTAPITGSVTDLTIAPGAFATDPTAAIMTISSLDTVWVTANVPEKDLGFVAVGQTVDVTLPAYPGKTFNGKVLFIGDVLDADTRRARVRIAFDNTFGLLKPGMFANAEFIAPTIPELFVPTSALLMINEKTSVFVEVAPWTFQRREVELDREADAVAVVRKGLSDGDRVIVKGGVLLGD